MMSVKTFCDSCHFIAWFVVNYTAIWLKLFCPFLWLEERVMGWWMTTPWKWFTDTPCVCFQYPSGCVFYSPWLARHEPFLGRLLYGDATLQVLSLLWRDIAMASGWMTNGDQKSQHLRHFHALSQRKSSRNAACSLWYYPLGWCFSPYKRRIGERCFLLIGVLNKALIFLIQPVHNGLIALFHLVFNVLWASTYRHNRFMNGEF